MLINDKRCISMHYNINHNIQTLEDLKQFAFQVPKTGMQTHYVPGAPNKMIKPAYSEKRVFIKDSPLFFVCEDGTFICPLLPGLEKILRDENFERVYMENPFPSLQLPLDYNSRIAQWNLIKQELDSSYYKNNSCKENDKDLDK